MLPQKRNDQIASLYADFEQVFKVWNENKSTALSSILFIDPEVVLYLYSFTHLSTWRIGPIAKGMGTRG